ncbi:hypothetical protein EV644_101380 [Kribbella orskensis]|uniref:Uncharacterized protein n=1 Tax=Kribbella orskensis TaxID=2512216 RepID=A0ABY2BUN1_9ACTN|nr:MULTISPECIES: hypothetical protein [Kribbella]TCN44484.1 hypothetical protein EV642_101609 [Kribbella sp. VKM Ac-2500]TCO31738.1 hypothetical protein EV644_101380 [Kribbella orskensis]
MSVPLAASTGTATFDQIAIVTGLVSLLYLALAVLLWRERTGRSTLVGRLADTIGRLDGVPRWAAITPYLHAVSLLACAFGVWWDIAVHIDKGRDIGPFGTPAHYPIFFGILGVIVSGVLPIALARKPLPARTIKLTKGWRIPCSAALVTFCGMFALVGFPMDDAWHRLFGEDVTLWGPTHLLMIGGVVLSIFARLLASAEVEQLAGINLRRRFQEIVAVGALLIAWDLFSTEFNYGVPQFPLILQPILIVFGAALAFALLRARRGPGTTFGALAVYLIIRGGIAWAVNQPLGEILSHFPLLIVEAVIVEVVALALGNKNRFRLGLVSGALIGTAGVLAEYWWSTVWMPIPWPSSMIPSALGFGVVAGIGAGQVGAWLATRYAEVAGEVRATPSVRRTHQLGAIGLVAVLAVLFFCVPRSADPGVSGTITLDRVATGAEPTAYVTVKLQPADAAVDARWFEAMSWQGGGFMTHRMVKVADGSYRSAEPLPMYGKWKSMVRLHQGQRDMVAMWVYAPEDLAIQKPAVQVSDGQMVEFIGEQQVLRREERTDVPRWMWNGGYALLAVVGSVEILGIAWLVGRGARGGRMRAAHLESQERAREIA